MSYKEFVPSAQPGSTLSTNDSSISPTLGKYQERNVDHLPYWSPASRRGDENSDEYSNMTAIVESSNANQLAISATEFIPSGVSAGAGMLRMQSVISFPRSRIQIRGSDCDEVLIMKCAACYEGHKRFAYLNHCLYFTFIV